MTGQSSAFEQDPRLTSFVLGELDEDEAAVIEKRLETDDQLRETVEAIRCTVAMVSEGLQAEAAPSLTDEQHATIQREAEAVDSPPVIFTMRRVLVGSGLALAACVALALILPLVIESARAPISDQPQSDGYAARSPAGRSSRPEDTESTKSLLSETVAPTGALDINSPDRDKAGEESWPEIADALEIAEGNGVFALSDSADDASPTASRSSAGVPAAAAGEPPETPPGSSSPDRGTSPPPGAPALDPQTGSSSPSGSAGRGGGGGNERGTAKGRRMPNLVNKRLPPGPNSVPSTGGESHPVPTYNDLGRSRLLFDDPEAPEHRRAGRSDTHNREAYDQIVDNPFRRVSRDPAMMPTFSIDVDTASYSNVRRFISAHDQLPPPDAVRIEELLNNFNYNDPPPPADSEEPFAVNVEVGPCPWKDDHRLMRIGLKGREVDMAMRPPTSLVFLLDVSGSMKDANKLPLVKESMRLLLDHLNADDRVALVTFSSQARTMLPGTYCTDANRQAIIDAIDGMRANGSTAGAAGLTLAYEVAADSFIEGGVNRIIICTDGDFNVDVSSDSEIVRLVTEKRETNVFLSALGFGEGNWQDAKMEKLTNAGNGLLAYIDTLDEARKILVEQMGGTLVTIAKDVKVQVDFNPAKVGAYRLIGYENRVMAATDFADDRKDAGDIGAGHSVTALFEVVPEGVEIDLPEVDESKYVEEDENREAASGEVSNELLEVRLRYKQPEGIESVERRFPVVEEEASLGETSADFRFAAGVACFGMILRDSPYKGESTYDLALDLAVSGAGEDPSVYLEDFVHYVRIAKPDLANANIVALLNTKASDEELAMMQRRRGLSDEEIDQALERASQMEETRQNVAELAPRMRRGRGAVPEDEKMISAPNHRGQFLDLIRKARRIQAQEDE